MTMLSDGMLLGVGGAQPQTFIASEANSALNGVTLTVNKPTGTQAGDLMIAYVYGSLYTSMAMTGWTQVFQELTAEADFTVFSKIAGGSEPASYSFSSAENNRSGGVLTYRGGAGLVDVVGTALSLTQTNPSTATSITAAHSGTLIAFFGIRNTYSVQTPPSGMTQRIYRGADALGVAVYDLSPSPAGATGAKTLSWLSAGTTFRHAIQLQIH